MLAYHPATTTHLPTPHHRLPKRAAAGSILFRSTSFREPFAGPALLEKNRGRQLACYHRLFLGAAAYGIPDRICEIRSEHPATTSSAFPRGEMLRFPAAVICAFGRCLFLLLLNRATRLHGFCVSGLEPLHAAA